MTTQTSERHFIRRAQQITALVPILLFQRGLLPKFKHWRLVQDSQTGMVVLFGVLDNRYITEHTPARFSDYFDPRLLRDLTTELHVQVFSTSNDGLRYTFIIEKGQADALMEIPALSGASMPGSCNALMINPPDCPTLDTDDTKLPAKPDKFLELTGDLAPINNAMTASLPDVLFMDEVEFNQRMAEFITTQLDSEPVDPTNDRLAEDALKLITGSEGFYNEGFPIFHNEIALDEKKIFARGTRPGVGSLEKD